MKVMVIVSYVLMVSVLTGYNILVLKDYPKTPKKFLILCLSMYTIAMALLITLILEVCASEL
jgi:hypothetical protein